MKSAIDVSFPTAGLNRRFAIQSQPPFTSADLLNVRPEADANGRERGGSRPGLSKAFNTQLGSGNPIRLLNQVREVFSTSQIVQSDDFDGDALSADWSAMPWTTPFNSERVGGLPVAPEVGGGMVKSKDTGAVEVVGGFAVEKEIQAAVHTAPNMDASQAYTLTATILPVANVLQGNYYLFVGLDDATPNVQANGVFLQVTTSASGGTTGYDVTIGEVVAGVITTFAMGSSTVSASSPATIYITVSSTNVTVGVNGSSLGPQAVNGSALPGTRYGFGVQHGVVGTSPIQACVGSLSLAYFADTDNFTQLNRTRMMASSNGILYRETATATMAAVANLNSLDLASDRLLQSSERLGSLFIADNGIRAEYTDGVYSGQSSSGGFFTANFDSASVSDWTTVADVGDTLWVFNATTPANARLSQITSVASGNIAVKSLDPAFVNETGASFRVLRGMKVYASSTDTLSSWVATDGEIPHGCNLVAKHLDRMYVAGAVDSPHAWFASRQGDPYDFDYGQPSTDLRRAVASTNADAGSFGEPITALIPFQDDHLIFGARSSMWILRGDPVQGGRIDNMSRITGCLSAQSWCYAPGGELFVLGSDGVYVFQVGTGGFSESTRNGSFSRDRIPDELKNINPEMFDVQMGYDVNDRGIHIFVTPKASTAGQRHWWIDLETSGFFPLTMPFTMEATSSHYYVADNPSDNAMLLGGRNGYIRKFDKMAATDDGTTISSYVYLGPFQTAPPGIGDGYIDTIIGTPAEDSGNVGWNLYVGKTAEAALNSTTSAGNGTFTAGLNKVFRPRRRGQSAFLRLSGTAPWSIEHLAMTRGKFGKLRID